MSVNPFNFGNSDPQQNVLRLADARPEYVAQDAPHVQHEILDAAIIALRNAAVISQEPAHEPVPVVPLNPYVVQEPYRGQQAA